MYNQMFIQENNEMVYDVMCRWKKDARWVEEIGEG